MGDISLRPILLGATQQTATRQGQEETTADARHQYLPGTRGVCIHRTFFASPCKHFPTVGASRARNCAMRHALPCAFTTFFGINLLQRSNRQQGLLIGISILGTLFLFLSRFLGEKYRALLQLRSLRVYYCRRRTLLRHCSMHPGGGGGMSGGKHHTNVFFGTHRQTCKSPPDAAQ